MRKLIIAAIFTFAASVSFADMEEGTHARVQPDGSSDIITIDNRDGQLPKVMYLEQTRQVGRNNPSSADVSYPTVCHYKQFGGITSEDKDSITYEVYSTVLVSRVKVNSKDQLQNDVNCNSFVNLETGRVHTGLSYTVQKAGFKKK